MILRTWYWRRYQIMSKGHYNIGRIITIIEIILRTMLVGTSLRAVIASLFIGVRACPRISKDGWAPNMLIMSFLCKQTIESDIIKPNPLLPLWALEGYSTHTECHLLYLRTRCSRVSFAHFGHTTKTWKKMSSIIQIASLARFWQ